MRALLKMLGWSLLGTLVGYFATYALMITYYRNVEPAHFEITLRWQEFGAMLWGFWGAAAGFVAGSIYGIRRVNRPRQELGEAHEEPIGHNSLARFSSINLNEPGIKLPLSFPIQLSISYRVNGLIEDFAPPFYSKDPLQAAEAVVHERGWSKLPGYDTKNVWVDGCF